MSVAATPRAQRNNNPLNIVKGSPWQGLMVPEMMTPEQEAETRFCVFSAPRWGFRAAAVTIITYFDKYQIDTIRGVIQRWAPPAENDTNAYIGFVCVHAGFSSDEVLDLHSYDVLFRLLKAMSQEEAGGWYFDDKDLEAGLRSAGVEPAPASFMASHGVPPKIIAGAAAGSAGLIDTVTDARDHLTQFAYMAWAAKGLMVLTVIIIGYELYQHYILRQKGLR